MSEARIIFTIAFFISVFFLPFPIFLFVGIILVSFFSAYLEALAGALIFDALFGAPGLFSFFYTALVFLWVVIAFFLREKMFA